MTSSRDLAAQRRAAAHLIANGAAEFVRGTCRTHRGCGGCRAGAQHAASPSYASASALRRLARQQGGAGPSRARSRSSATSPGDPNFAGGCERRSPRRRSRRGRELAAVRAHRARRFERRRGGAAGFSFARQCRLCSRSNCARKGPRLRGVSGRDRSEPFHASGGSPRFALIHGERDETVPLAAVLDWARPHDSGDRAAGSGSLFSRAAAHLRTIVQKNWGA